MVIDIITRTAYNDVDYLGGNYWEPGSEEEHCEEEINMEYLSELPSIPEFTGLLDKDGKKIFVGDILEINC